VNLLNTNEHKLIIEALATHKRFHSLNAIKRRKIILDLLEERKLIEINLDFTRLMSEIVGGGTKMDRKTITRLACNLEKSGDLKRYTVSLPLLNGSFQNRTLLLHPSLDTHDELVTRHISEAKSKLMLSGVGKMPNVPVKDMKVEKLEDLIKRGDAPLVNVPWRRDVQTDKKEEDVMNKNNNSEWITNALNYGWISARMIRSKIFHEFLFHIVYSRFEQDGKIDENGRIMPFTPETEAEWKAKWNIEIIVIFSEITLDLYLKIIGHTTPSPLLNNYLSEKKPLNVRIHKLPQDLRCEVFFLRNKTRLRKNIKNMIDLLVCLGLLREPTEGPVEFPFLKESLLANVCKAPTHTSYQLICDSKLYNIAKSDKPYVRDCRFDSRHALRTYWNELQYICEDQESRGGRLTAVSDAESIKNAAQEFLKKGKLSNNPLLNLDNNRNWKCVYPFTIEQRRVLESYIDKKYGRTPLDDEIKCSEVASILAVHPSRVKTFFRMFEEVYFRKVMHNKMKQFTKNIKASGKESKKAAALSKEITQSLNENLNHLKGATRVVRTKIGSKTAKEKAKRVVKPRSWPTESNQRRRFYAKNVSQIIKRGEDPDEVEQKLCEIGEDKSMEEGVQAISEKAKRTIYNFSAESDELLILCYVILRVKFMGFRFVYSPALVYFPHLVADQLRRRVAQLRKSAENERRLQHLLTKWQLLYPIAIENGDLPPDPELTPEEEANLTQFKKIQLRMTRFDIKAYIEYFQNVLSEEPMYVFCLCGKYCLNIYIVECFMNQSRSSTNFPCH
jgi:hypothetical protein